MVHGATGQYACFRFTMLHVHHMGKRTDVTWRHMGSALMPLHSHHSAHCTVNSRPSLVAVVPCRHAVMLLESSPPRIAQGGRPSRRLPRSMRCLQPLSPVQHGELDDLGEVLGCVLAEEGAQVAVAHQVRADLLEPGGLLAGGAHGGAKAEEKEGKVKHGSTRCCTRERY